MDSQYRCEWTDLIRLLDGMVNIQSSRIYSDRERWIRYDIMMRVVRWEIGVSESRPRKQSHDDATVALTTVLLLDTDKRPDNNQYDYLLSNNHRLPTILISKNSFTWTSSIKEYQPFQVFRIRTSDDSHHLKSTPSNPYLETITYTPYTHGLQPICISSPLTASHYTNLITAMIYTLALCTTPIINILTRVNTQRWIQ